MENMVERVAKVLYLRTPQTMDVFTRDYADPKSVLSVGVAPIPWEDLDDEDRDPFIEAARAAIEAMRPELETARQALREVAHAQSSGANWYTHGASGLYQQVAMHVKRGSDALDPLLADRSA